VITKQEVEQGEAGQAGVSAQEKEKLTSSSNILTYVEKLSELDTKGVEPTPMFLISRT
jgi:Asp-tRNA(Asn)/Glu-tRNA(Gln) amidotransferase C subunit